MSSPAICNGSETLGRLSEPVSESPDGGGNFAALQTHVPTAPFDHFTRLGVPPRSLARGAGALLWNRHLASDDFLVASHFGACPGWIEPVRVRVNAAEPVLSWLKGFDGLLREIERRGPPSLPLSSPENRSAETGIFVAETDQEIKALDVLAAKLGLTLRLYVRPQAGCLHWRYNPNAFRAHAIAALGRCFETLLGSMAAAWSAPVGQLPLLTVAEERQIIGDWNQTQATFAADTCIHQFFEDQAGRTPEAVALVFRDAAWTYRELNTRADALAARLKSAGIGPGALVAVALNRSLELMAALLAVLKAGGAYVPVDPTYPSQRLSLMLEDARPAVVIASRRTVEKIPPTACAVLRVEDADPEPAKPAVPGLGAASSDPAYVIYTSGSTGKPKGVIVTHRNAANFFAAMDAIIGHEPGVWLAVTSVSFDISVLELFWTLARGFRVVIQEEGQLASSSGPGYSLAQQMRRHAVTHLQCTPSLASMLLRDPESLAALRPLRRLIVGGEALALDLARKLSGAIAGELYNMYGPTETTIWSTACRIGRDDERVLIGRPIANTQLYVLDPQRRPVPIGTPGELYIGGAGVAAGYLRRPELTAERFVTNPFSKDEGLLYRTGDIVRYEPDGAVEFLGRADQQIKIRGFRVELGEIELVLRQHPQVRDAVVAVRNDAHHEDDKRLVAYAIAARPDVITGWALRGWLRGQLPEAMVPSTVMLVDRFPLTPNGKVDKNALPVPVTDSDPELEPPSNDLEEAIAAIWADVLGLPAVSVTRGFFDVGGHSLLMAEVHDQIQDKLGCEVPLIELFHHPTVRSLAAYLTEQSSLKPAATGAARGQLRQQSQMRRAAGRKAAATAKS